MNDAYVGCDLPSLDQQLLKDEFHEAADLLSRALRAKGKPLEENKDAIALPEIVENKTSNKETESTMLQNLDTCTRSNDLQTDKCQAVTKDRNRLTDCNSDINSCNFESNEQDNRSSESRIQDTNLSTSDLDNFTRLNHEAVSSNESTGPEEFAETKSVIKEQDSDSEDELEQFVFQPRSNREEEFEFSFT
ncbi:uncharacterized protein LOC144628400 [Oculina patagonica]